MIPLYDNEDESKGFPSHVKVESIYLFSSVDTNTAAKYANDETAYDLKNGYNISHVTSELNFIESLYSIAVSGTITITDNFSFFQDARIHGQELLLMKFRRFNPEEQRYDLTFFREFYVSKVASYERQEFHAVFTLEFISPHAIADRYKRISRAYGYTDVGEGSFNANDISGASDKFKAWERKYKQIDIEYHGPGKIIGDDSELGKDYTGLIFDMEMPEQFVYHLLTNDLSIPKDRVFLVGYHPEDDNSDDHSQKRMKLVVPGWRPIQTIRWLMRNIFSKDGDPWFCYETFWGGIRIEPYKILIGHEEKLNNGQMWGSGRTEKVLKHTYIYNKLFFPVPNTVEYFIDAHRKVLDLKIGFSFDQFTKISTGAYSSYEWYVDIASKYMIPNDVTPIEETLLKYDDTVNEDSWLKDHYRPFSKNVEEHKPPQHAPDFQESNYTYYVPYNTALHGTTEDTYPYNSAFNFTELNAATVELPGGSNPTTPPGDPNIEPDPNCPFTRSNFDKNDPKWHAYLLSLEQEYGMPTGYMWGIMMQESRGNPNAQSPAGAKGLFQFMPDTAKERGLADPYDPCTSARASAQYLSSIRKQHKTDSWQIAAYGYNSGPNLKIYGQMARGEIPMGSGIKSSETKNYWPGVQKYMEQAPYNSGSTQSIEEDAAPKTSEVGILDETAVVAYSMESKGIDLGKFGRTGEMKKKNLDFIQHQMRVYGDFRLNPGAVIDLEIQRTIDPILIQSGKISGLRDEDLLDDTYISGQYFVIDAKHQFNSDGFFTTATISRPSSSLDLN